MTGITTSVAVLFSVLSFNRGFERGLERELERTGIHFMIVPSGCPHEVASLVLHGAVIPKFLDLKVMEHLRNVREIELASPFLVGQIPNPEKGRIDLIYGLEMKHLRRLKPSWKVIGSIPESDNEVIIGAEIASHDRINIGDIINYPSVKRTFRVAGILERTGGQDDAFIYMPLKSAQDLFNRPEGSTAIGVRVSDPANLNKVIEELSRDIPGIQIVTMGQVMNSLSSLASSGKVLSLSMAVIAILISASGVMNSILMSVFERTQEIGMMRAVGASRFDIFRIILKETVILTLTGGITGIFLANIGSGIIEFFVRKFIPYVPSGSMISFEPELAALCIFFSLFTGILSGFYPAWKASKITPIEAIRG
ncbi:MAG: ABC transporter permease [Thermodesulfovibrionales bacterium]|nr:ABC transporter permease [Thermodesulfovibrionales bacterium]